MTYPNISTFLRDGKAALAKGPVGLIMVEDDIEIKSTIDHHLRAGFHALVVFAGGEIASLEDLPSNVHWVVHDMAEDAALETAVNSVIAAAPGLWLYYCYNSEYLHYPFSEDRTIGEMLAFNSEERRETILTFTIDLYAGDLTVTPNAVSLEDAHMDTSGYYALARWNGKSYEERQLDFFGGLRWRFEEHVPWTRRRIDRVSLFRARPGLELQSDHTFNIPEFNTYACQWHNNLTATVCSFRTAKALKRNPGSRNAIHDFKWRSSTPFEWSSSQLMNLGMMEPGQWF
jgi:hypothetical protein